MVLDFANEAAHIQKAFQDYYEKTLLSEETDPNLLYDLQRELSEFALYSDAEIELFASFYYTAHETQDRLYMVLAPVRERYQDVSAQEQADFRKRLNDYTPASSLSPELAHLELLVQRELMTPIPGYPPPGSPPEASEASGGNIFNAYLDTTNEPYAVLFDDTLLNHHRSYPRRGTTERKTLTNI